MRLLFDIGGSNMRLAVSESGNEIQQPLIFKTPHDFAEAIGQIEDAVKQLGEGKKIEETVGGIAGFFNPKKGALSTSPNLPGWVDKPLLQELERISKSPVRIENDADLAGLAEARRGAGQGEEIVAYLTLGTGIGGARIVGGQIDAHALGFEPGQQIIKADEGLTLEQCISGAALKARYGKEVEEIDDPAALEEILRLVAIGVHNAIVHWSPNIVVLGGGMIVKERGLALEEIETHVASILKIFPEAPPLKKAELGDLAGLYGALELLQ